MNKMLLNGLIVISSMLVFQGCSDDESTDPVSPSYNAFDCSTSQSCISEDTTWSGQVSLETQTYVTNGATLTIEAGTTITATATDEAGLATALVIDRGAKIMAEGTAESPITFTSVVGTGTGTWGGLIINGNAPISNDGGEAFVEGLVGVPYGGNDPADNSGTLRYVRVWHGGNVIGQDNEINGITLAGVGNSTIVDHCEVAYNQDDGFEMFGGTVDLTNCAVINVGDDAFDTDNGYQGRGQFLFVHRDGNSDKAHEMDNKTDSNFDSQPRSHPIFSNVTIVGGNENAVRVREGTGGDFRNYIIVGGGEGFRNDDNGTELVTQDFSSTSGLYPDYLYISSNNVVYNGDSGCFKDFEDSSTFSGTCVGSDTGVTGEPLNVIPTSAGAAYEGVDTVESDWFVQTDYKGAFGTTNWHIGWSILSQ